MKYAKEKRLRKLGANVKRIRKVEYRSQEMLAEVLDEDRLRIARVESGAHESGVLLFVDIAKACHVSLDELMGNLDD